MRAAVLIALAWGGCSQGDARPGGSVHHLRSPWQELDLPAFSRGKLIKQQCDTLVLRFEKPEPQLEELVGDRLKALGWTPHVWAKPPCWDDDCWSALGLRLDRGQASLSMHVSGNEPSSSHLEISFNLSGEPDPCAESLH